MYAKCTYSVIHTHTLIHCKTQTSTKSQQPQKYTRKDCCIANNCGRKQLKWSKIQWHTRIWALFAMQKYDTNTICICLFAFFMFLKKIKIVITCANARKKLWKRRERHTQGEINKIKAERKRTIWRTERRWQQQQQNMWACETRWTRSLRISFQF